jgi:hypothetical protein
MVTISIIRSFSSIARGFAKKMLNVPTLDMLVVKEVPIYSREHRKVVKQWIQIWENQIMNYKFSKTNYYSSSVKNKLANKIAEKEKSSFLQVFGSFWNSPEGCVSIATEYADNGSVNSLINGIG